MFSPATRARRYGALVSRSYVLASGLADRDLGAWFNDLQKVYIELGKRHEGAMNWHTHGCPLPLGPGY